MGCPYKSFISHDILSVRDVGVHSVRLTDLIRAGLRKTDMVAFAFGNELGHDACALLKGDALNDTCGLEQV